MKPLTAKQIMAMISAGENNHVDFKRGLFLPEADKPRITQHFELAKDLAAFANSDGGYLLVGVDDDGQVVGFKSNDLLEQRIINLCRDIISPPLKPDIYKAKVKDKEVLVIRVERGQGYLHLVRDKVYIRVHNEVRVASSEEITEIVLERNHQKLRSLLQEKENLSLLIIKVSKLSSELFRAKTLITEIEANDFCQAQIDLSDYNDGINVYKLIKQAENHLTNLDMVELGNLLEFLLRLDQAIQQLEQINQELETLLDTYYCQIEGK
ncbi:MULTISPECIES: helix-turn-helix domain-containing protein [Carboxydocella]|uniref:DNA-binding domain-containing protein n=2 Tax=Carboxydocella TaxID=178898 RepID=A0A2R4N0Q8_CARTR|nr:MULTISPECIES: ATP-binding protein [Carboxydocella]AVX20654.1 Putative DNA-binding domain-containing protein [Carboxydocella thermautotrophica]GAW27976.1 AAA family ATPase [Carboxydocella sp. ULO1]GAW32494.1 AAA family ATPase [Carboxydocella sp. JDF658]SJZ59143.1 Putative DNA-binding domain-containing protein [Carboxydocella sporoproducens DSM 16521]